MSDQLSGSGISSKQNRREHSLLSEEKWRCFFTSLLYWYGIYKLFRLDQDSTDKDVFAVFLGSFVYFCFSYVVGYDFTANSFVAFTEGRNIFQLVPWDIA